MGQMRGAWNSSTRSHKDHAAAFRINQSPSVDPFLLLLRSSHVVCPPCGSVPHWGHTLPSRGGWFMTARIRSYDVHWLSNRIFNIRHFNQHRGPTEAWNPLRLIWWWSSSGGGLHLPVPSASRTGTFQTQTMTPQTLAETFPSRESKDPSS